jgi:hypothetical protein
VRAGARFEPPHNISPFVPSLSKHRPSSGVVEREGRPFDKLKANEVGSRY